MGLRTTLRELYAGTGPRLRGLRWLLLAFDVAVVLFFLVTTFLEPTEWLLAADYALAALLLLDYLGRWAAADDPVGYPVKPMPVVDVAVLLSLLAPALIENLGFLRLLRTLRLLRSYHVLKELRGASTFFARHEEVIFSALNVIVFVFMVSALVYVLQAQHNPAIGNYIDAVYFTVTTLTTTGFGDITLTGQVGRLLAVLIMVVGVGLFLRLIQAIFRPRKIAYDCPDCGLSRHDPDAVHCKHCGRTLRIPTLGE